LFVIELVLVCSDRVGDSVGGGREICNWFVIQSVFVRNRVSDTVSDKVGDELVVTQILG